MQQFTELDMEHRTPQHFQVPSAERRPPLPVSEVGPLIGRLFLDLHMDLKLRKQHQNPEIGDRLDSRLFYTTVLLSPSSNAIKQWHYQ